MPIEILYAIPMGLTLSFSAGPVFFLVIQTSIQHGKMRASLFDLGAITADIIYILLAFYSSQKFLLTLRDNVYVAVISGLAVIIFGGYYIRKSSVGGQFKSQYVKARRRIFYLKGFLLNFLNIGVLFYWITTTVAIGSLLEHDEEHMKLFYAATLITYIIIDGFKIYFANKFQKRLSGRTIQLVEKILGMVLIAFGLFILIRGFFL